MQFEQIYRCINVLWDMKMILAPFGWWTTMSFVRDAIWAEVDPVNTNRMPMDNRHHHQQIILIILLRIVWIHSKHQTFAPKWDLFTFLFWLKMNKMRNEENTFTLKLKQTKNWIDGLSLRFMSYCVLENLSFFPTDSL